MYVKERMAKDVLTIHADFKISEALSVMSNHDLHRLPVVKEQKLVGLITEGVIASHTPSKASSLSVHEMNYLLSKMTVKDIMITDVVTIGPDALLEEAANIMRKSDVGCLPVVINGDQLVGIITINDVMDAFVEMSGFFATGTRYEIKVHDDHIGVLAALTEIFAEHQANIYRLSVYNDADPIVIVRTSLLNTEALEADLISKGFDIKAKHITN
jgi:acetoin utilization protein AcuB